MIKVILNGVYNLKLEQPWGGIWVIIYPNYILSEKLMIFIEFKKEILRTYVLRMTVKGGLIDIRKRATLFVILSEAKNLILLLNFSPDVFGL
jgi:hypothetical protein